MFHIEPHVPHSMPHVPHGTPHVPLGMPHLNIPHERVSRPGGGRVSAGRITKPRERPSYRISERRFQEFRQSMREMTVAERTTLENAVSGPRNIRGGRVPESHASSLRKGTLLGELKRPTTRAELHGYGSKVNDQTRKALAVVDVTPEEMRDAINEGPRGIEELAEKKPRFKFAFKEWFDRALKAGVLAMGITGLVYFSKLVNKPAEYFAMIANSESGCFMLRLKDGVTKDCKIPQLSCCSKKQFANIHVCSDIPDSVYKLSEPCKDHDKAKDDCCNGKCNLAALDEKDESIELVCRDVTAIESFVRFIGNNIERAVMWFVPYLVTVAIGCGVFGASYLTLPLAFKNIKTPILMALSLSLSILSGYAYFSNAKGAAPA